LITIPTKLPPWELKKVTISIFIARFLKTIEATFIPISINSKIMVAVHAHSLLLDNP
jgi:hypothetical protein